MITTELQWQIHLFLAGLGFLQAKNIWIRSAHEIRHAFRERRADSVYIPRNE
jgi:hypothetical protein